MVRGQLQRSRVIVDGFADEAAAHDEPSDIFDLGTPETPNILEWCSTVLEARESLVCNWHLSRARR